MKFSEIFEVLHSSTPLWSLLSNLPHFYSPSVDATSPCAHKASTSIYSPKGEKASFCLQVMGMIDASNRDVFSDRLRYLEKRMSGAIHKLTWTSAKPALDFFFREARK